MKQYYYYVLRHVLKECAMAEILFSDRSNEAEGAEGICNMTQLPRRVRVVIGRRKGHHFNPSVQNFSDERRSAVIR